MTTTPDEAPTDYPSSWRPKCAPPKPPAIEVQLEEHLRGLTPVELAQLLARVRGGQR